MSSIVTSELESESESEREEEKNKQQIINSSPNHANRPFVIGVTGGTGQLYILINNQFKSITVGREKVEMILLICVCICVLLLYVC